MRHPITQRPLMLLLLHCCCWCQDDCQQAGVTAPVQAVDHQTITAAAAAAIAATAASTATAAVVCKGRHIESTMLQTIPFVQDNMLLPTAVWLLLGGSSGSSSSVSSGGSTWCCLGS